jgi:chaperonin cofactor prefoldin
MDKIKLKDKRYLALIRVSDARQTDSSAEAQEKLLRAYGDGNGMLYVGNVDEIDISGSMPARREKLLQDVIQRKRDKNDFEVALVQRMDRFTRSGPGHGFWLEQECKRVGIKLIFVCDDIPEGRYSDLIKVAKYGAAQEQAHSTSQRSTQGFQLALETGRCITSSRTPYGCWRLYLSADGQPLHIIRDLRNGQQEMLDPMTRERKALYGEVGGGARGHYRKQQGERVLLTPGDSKEIAIVREIFDLHFRQGWGSKRIAGELMRRQIPSPMGRGWSQNQVEVIYSRECYTGRSVGNRTSSALYHERNRDRPKSVEIDEEIAINRKYLPKRERPLEEWFIQDQPLMADFLNPDLRRLAIAGQEQIWKDRFDPRREKRRVPKHSASEYLLSGLLRCKQDGEPLTGVLCGRSDARVRYYRHRRGARDYIKGGIFNRMIPCDPLETAVIAVAQDVLTNMPDLDQLIASAVQEQLAAMDSAAADLEELRRQREKVRNRLQLIISTFDEETLSDAKSEVERLRGERQEVDRKIGQLEMMATLGDVERGTICQRVRERVATLSNDIKTMPPLVLQRMLPTIIDSMVADMDTKEVEIHFALPSWVFEESPSDMMRPGLSSRSSIGSQTHPFSALEIAVADCRYSLRSSHVCYDCNRRRAA